MANDQDCDEENTKIVISLRSKQKTFYSRAARRLVHGILHRVATLIHTIPEQDEEDENSEYNKQSVGKWYTGKVFYSIKDMLTQGSSAMCVVAELSAALTSHYELEECPSRMYLYTDGGSDRKNSNFKVQKSLISLFLYHDFDDLISARPAAGHSYRKPICRDDEI